MTYNLRFDNPADGEDAWPERKDFLIRQVAYHAPDVMGTQEGKRHQVQAMDSALTAYAFIGRGRDDSPDQGEYSALFYRTDRLELLDAGTFWLSETPEVPSRGWDAALNRICTYGKFRPLAGGQVFFVFNTHFDHIGEEARARSVELLLVKIRELNPQGYPVVLTGDLNLEPDTTPILHLSEAMQDSFSAAGITPYGPVGTFNGFDCTSPATRRIDYVFVSRGDFEVHSHATLSETRERGFPSDHFPVLSVLRFLD